MKITDLVPANERRYSYLTEVAGLEFEESLEGIERSWIHAAPINRKFKHPFYGTINFSEKKIRNFVQNFQEKVRKIDLAIDYSHNSGDKAAGWVKDVEHRSDGLWLLVEWTKAAAEAIRNKEFRYFSPEFADEYIDAETGKKYKDVLFGGGLTNRPFLKDLVPVNLSEVFTEEESADNDEKEGQQQEDETVNAFMEQMRKALKLSDDATEDQILAAVAAANRPDDDVRRELAEVKDLLVKQAAETKLLKVTSQLSEWERGDGKKFALPPAAHDSLLEILMNAPVALADKVSTVVDSLLNTGLVALDEIGTTSVKRQDNEDQKDESEELNESEATQKFNDLILSIQKEYPDMALGDVIEEAARRDEKLFEEYRRDSWSFTTDGGDS